MESNQVAALSIGLSILFVTGVFVLLSGYYKNRTFFDSNTVFYVKKWTYILFLVSLNVVGCVFVYYFRSLNVLVYVILALKSKDLITSVVFLFNMIYKHLFTNLEIPQLTVTDEIKRIVALVPVYNETIEQLTKTVDSILNSNVTPNYTMPCIVVDGLENNYLEIFDELIVSKKDLYYKNWFGSDVSTNVFYGKRRDHHIMMIQKATRVGKKDTIILVNDILLLLLFENNTITLEWKEAKQLTNDDMLVYSIPKYQEDNDNISQDDCYFYGILLGYGCLDNKNVDVRLNINDIDNYDLMTNMNKIKDLFVKYEVDSGLVKSYPNYGFWEKSYSGLSYFKGSKEGKFKYTRAGNFVFQDGFKNWYNPRETSSNIGNDFMLADIDKDGTSELIHHPFIGTNLILWITL